MQWAAWLVGSSWPSSIICWVMFKVELFIYHNTKPSRGSIWKKKKKKEEEEEEEKDDKKSRKSMYSLPLWYMSLPQLSVMVTMNNISKTEQKLFVYFFQYLLVSKTVISWYSLVASIHFVCLCATSIFKAWKVQHFLCAYLFKSFFTATCKT